MAELDTIRNIVKSAMDGEPLAIRSALDDVMTGKVADAIAGLRTAVAENTFGKASVAVTEESVINEAVNDRPDAKKMWNLVKPKAKWSAFQKARWDKEGDDDTHPVHKSTHHDIIAFHNPDDPDDMTHVGQHHEADGTKHSHTSIDVSSGTKLEKSDIHAHVAEQNPHLSAATHEKLATEIHKDYKQHYTIPYGK
jgi:hypothetical protein